MKIMMTATLLMAALTATNAHADAFNGGYVGAVVGYDKLSLKATVSGVGGTTSGDSISGGALIGYNAKVGENFVIGAEVEGVIGGGTLTDGVDTIDTDYSLNAGVRAGFLISSQALIYGKLAYARTRLSVDDEGEDGDGIAFGGGVEFAFSDSVTARIAYTRTSYSVDEDLQAAFGGDIDIDRDQVMAGVAFHF